MVDHDNTLDPTITHRARVFRAVRNDSIGTVGSSFPGGAVAPAFPNTAGGSYHIVLNNSGTAVQWSRLRTPVTNTQEIHQTRRNRVVNSNGNVSVATGGNPGTGGAVAPALYNGATPPASHGLIHRAVVIAAYAFYPCEPYQWFGLIQRAVVIILYWIIPVLR